MCEKVGLADGTLTAEIENVVHPPYGGWEVVLTTGQATSWTWLTEDQTTREGAVRIAAQKLRDLADELLDSLANSERESR